MAFAISKFEYYSKSLAISNMQCTHNRYKKTPELEECCKEEWEKEMKNKNGISQLVAKKYLEAVIFARGDIDWKTV